MNNTNDTGAGGRAIDVAFPSAAYQTMVAIENEITRAKTKHPGNFHNHHEAFAVLKEEVDEYWDEVKKDAPASRKREELIQIAAMAIRTINELT